MKSIEFSEYSNIFYEKKKIEKLKEIFYKLDSDNDGYISADKIDIYSIEPFILQKFLPIFSEIEESNEEINEEEFVEAANLLFSSFTVLERGEILKRKLKNDSENKFSFQV